MRGFCLEVAGEFACFTRPEMKVERVSYDVITPSAARAIYSAILWKPAIKWRITKIEILNPIRWISIRRNELASVTSTQSTGVYIEDDRQQRAGLILRDVRYRVFAEFDFLLPADRPKTNNPSPEWLQENNETAANSASDENEHKYAAMFSRRAKKGQCFMQPYLGCREFSCSFKLLESEEANEPAPIAETRDLGFMLYDLDYSNPKDIKAMFYRPKLENGTIIVPHEDSEEVYR